MLGERDAEFTFYCIWPLPARVSFPACRMSLLAGPAQHRLLCYDSVCPWCHHFEGDLGYIVFVRLST